jgi:hypothetical protein
MGQTLTIFIVRVLWLLPAVVEGERILSYRYQMGPIPTQKTQLMRKRLLPLPFAIRPHLC